MNNVIDTTQKLMRHRSTKERPEAINACIEEIIRMFGKGFHVERLKRNGKQALHISGDGQKHHHILLSGHIDVVEGTGEQFTPRIEGDKLIGRGSADMKGGVAAIIHALQATKGKSVAALLTSDEETGGNDGARIYAEEGYGGDIVIAAEVNRSPTPDRYTITTRTKGVIWVKITAKGTSTHASTPWKGKNAIDKLLKTYQRIKEHYPETDKQWRTTVNLGIITGGNTPNMVPDHAEMTLDIRSITQPETVVAFLNTLPEVDVDILTTGTMVANDENNKELLALQRTIETISGHPCKLSKENGASDIRHFAAPKRATIVFGPWGEDIHGKEEYVNTKNLRAYTDILTTYIDANG